MSDLSLTINAVEKEKYVDRKSLNINNILTRQVDTCSFTIESYGDRINNPVNGQEIIITKSGVRIFGGTIKQVSQQTKDPLILDYKVDCIDFTSQLDRMIVNRSFENLTINQIFSILLTDYGLAANGFDIDNVDSTFLVEYISFKFENIADVIEQLANLSNNEWYVDYYKSIHFFSKEKLSAPFNVTDTNGNAINSSLVIRKNNNQIRNIIYVRGGEYLADTFTSEFEADGEQILFNIGYKYGTADMSITLTGQSLNFGIEPRDLPENHDCLWNPDEKVVRFRNERKPNAGSVFKVVGQPYLPVLVKYKSQTDINKMISVEGGTGIYEHAIIDKSINSKEGARARAQAEIATYSRTLTESSFLTYTPGLKAGQQIQIQSDIHGIDETYVINKVQFKMWTEDDFIYNISMITKRSYGIIDFFKELLRDKKKATIVKENEILDQVESAEDSFKMTDTVSAYSEVNKYDEEFTLSDTVTGEEIDLTALEFVAGPWSNIADDKRQFICDGSPLGPYPYATT